MFSFKIKIADVVFLVKANYLDTRNYFSSFLSEEEAVEEICINENDIDIFQKSMPDFDRQMSERAVLKYRMDKILVDYGAFPFHASALSYKGEGYVFTALSGVGKSTHTRIWKETYGEDVIIINDDRPYLKVIGDSVFAFSHPQAGKHMLYTNTKCQIRAIGKIVRDEQNYVKPVTQAEFFPFFVQQTFTMDEPKTTWSIISLIKKVLERVSLYEIHCNMDSNAAELIYEHIQGDLGKYKSENESDALS